MNNGKGKRLLGIFILIIINCCWAYESKLTLTKAKSNCEHLDNQSISQLQPILEQGFNDTVFPPPGWRTVTIQGEYNWEWDGLFFPPPYESVGMARYRSLLASLGSMARLMSPPIAPTNIQNFLLTFWMFHDPSYSVLPDSVKV
ncbi:MAG: hypothetical protein N2748_04160, partial [candidate division WOR-3 bacterium]|nr:hypothetical protein [candidate division WOR-3 bacterium]